MTDLAALALVIGVCVLLTPYAWFLGEKCGERLREWVMRRRYPPGSCPRCGYSRAGIAADADCPECGAGPRGGRVVK